MRRKIALLVSALLLVLVLTTAYSAYVEYSYSLPAHSPLLRVLSSYTPSSVLGTEEPVRVVIDSVGIDIPVLNPASIEKDVLETAMFTGAVRYPTSSLLGQEGVMVLLGHSSNIPVVRNKGYKAFNGLQNLKKGEIIKVYSDRKEYFYTVTSLRLVKNESDIIGLSSSGKSLKLLTTDLRDKSFNTRWLAEADFLGAN